MLITRHTYRTSIFTGLSGILQRFLDDILGTEKLQDDVRDAIVQKQ